MKAVGKQFIWMTLTRYPLTDVNLQCVRLLGDSSCWLAGWQAGRLKSQVCEYVVIVALGKVPFMSTLA